MLKTQERDFMTVVVSLIFSRLCENFSKTGDSFMLW